MTIIQPLISVIIPTYKRQSMLAETLTSVLNQNYQNIEVIIIDDCSPDNTQEYVHGLNLPNIHYYRNAKNQGAGYARKFGYEMSKGDYLIFMDDDDYYTDFDFFTKAMEIFKTNPKGLAFVAGNAKIKYEDLQTFQFNPLNVQGHINNWDYLRYFQTKYNKPYSTFSAIFSKIALNKGNFSDLIMVNDSSIYIRALLGGDAYFLTEIIGIYRIHQHNITSNLKPDFMISNLKEKAIVSKILSQYTNTIDPNQWWKDQVLVTMKYYIGSTKPTYPAYHQVQQWVIGNTTAMRDKISLFIKLRYRYFKTKMIQTIRKAK